MQHLGPRRLGLQLGVVDHSRQITRRAEGVRCEGERVEGGWFGYGDGGHIAPVPGSAKSRVKGSVSVDHVGKGPCPRTEIGCGRASCRSRSITPKYGLFESPLGSRGGKERQNEFPCFRLPLGAPFPGSQHLTAVEHTDLRLSVL